jgi:hypothetical protein
MAKAGEDLMDQTLRWMTENLNGAYNAVHPDGHPKAGNHCTNSGTCILVCCYINALGKVLLKGGPLKPNRRDFLRFREFLQRCMDDFLIQSQAMSLPQTPKGRTGGDEWLYEVFRCGFIHGFYPGANIAWGHKPDSKKYLFWHKGRLTLNIDEFVRGFERGLKEFRGLAEAELDLRINFKDYITAD